MPRSTTRKRKARGEVMPLLSVSDRIDSLLKEMLAVFKEKTELTEGEIEHWHRDLQPFPSQAIEWSFDAHRRNGRFFPLPGDILDLCIAWQPAEDPGVCNAACRKKHNKGYGESDILWLYAKYNEKQASLPKIIVNGKLQTRPLEDYEVDELLVALDKHRGKVPEWRA